LLYASILQIISNDFRHTYHRKKHQKRTKNTAFLPQKRAKNGRFCSKSFKNVPF
jgi:hypothetical protein